MSPAPAPRQVLLAMICARDAREGGHQVLGPTVLLMRMLPLDVGSSGALGSPMGSGHSWAASSLPKAGVEGLRRPRWCWILSSAFTLWRPVELGILMGAL